MNCGLTHFNATVLNYKKCSINTSQLAVYSAFFIYNEIFLMKNVIVPQLPPPVFIYLFKINNGPKIGLNFCKKNI